VIVARPAIVYAFRPRVGKPAGAARAVHQLVAQDSQRIFGLKLSDCGVLAAAERMIVTIVSPTTSS
jgi:hypothetical protein